MKIIKLYVFDTFFVFAYIALGRVWIAPKGCGEAPGHFPHQEKFWGRFFKKRFFEIFGRISEYSVKYQNMVQNTTFWAWQHSRRGFVFLKNTVPISKTNQNQ